MCVTSNSRTRSLSRRRLTANNRGCRSCEASAAERDTTVGVEINGESIIAYWILHVFGMSL